VTKKEKAPVFAS